MQVSGGQWTVAIVPARGGSKRIPRKNIRPFAGVPLIVRTLEMIQSCGVFDLVHVSTDDDEIAGICAEVGAHVGWRRPAELANDTAVTAAVVDWEVHRISDLLGTPPVNICTIYPAAVLIRSDQILDAFAVFRAGSFDAVISALRHPSPIWRGLRVDDQGLARMIWPENRLKRSQELEETYYDAGQFYWSTDRYWSYELDDEAARASRVGLYEVSRNDAVDIDTEDDWAFAENLFRARGMSDDSHGSGHPS